MMQSRSGLSVAAPMGDRFRVFDRPARRIEFAGLEVQHIPRGYDCVIVACVALNRTDVANAAVTKIEVAHARPGQGRGRVPGTRLAPNQSPR